jgi:hypothetical protein
MWLSYFFYSILRQLYWYHQKEASGASSEGIYLSILLKVDHETLMHPYETLLADVMYDAMHMQCLINAA